MNEKTEANISDIAELIVKMKAYDGQKIGHDIDRIMMNYRAQIIELSGNEVSVDFNSIDTNIVSGVYHTYVYYADEEVKEAVKGAVEEAEEAAEDEEETPTTRDISFTINDGSTGISGATVKVGSDTKTTGSAGGCTFSGVADGSYSVEVSATGYTTKTESITVSSANTSFTISLTASGI